MSQTQDEINDGQQRVNYKLVQMNQHVVEVLKEIIDILKTVSADRLDPRAASRLLQVDLSGLEELLSSADSATKEIATITPPGCSSEQNSESFLRVARSLNLDGPPDWSSHIDDYLYGRNERIDE